MNATSVLLEPLAPDAAAELAGSLLDGVDLDESTRERIVSTAEGNPLFLEELASLARDRTGVGVPPTIQAVLQARLDVLDEQERTVIERGAVEGKVFHRTSVTALSPEQLRGDMSGHLLSLVRKELVRPARALIPGDEAFRFRHLLIRDAAYESLPKAVRADLHERFADWLDAHVALLEQDEIIGYHLEQAARYRAELDPGDLRVAELGARAAARLGAAGHAAFGRDDLHATRNLLERADSAPAGGAAQAVAAHRPDPRRDRGRGQGTRGLAARRAPPRRRGQPGLGDGTRSPARSRDDGRGSRRGSRPTDRRRADAPFGRGSCGHRMLPRGAILALLGAGLRDGRAPRRRRRTRDSTRGRHRGTAEHPDHMGRAERHPQRSLCA